MNNRSVHQFVVQKPDGEEISLSQFRSKVLLIVNTASACGLTPQLKALEQLRQLFAGGNFEVLAFPSNDFGNQEPLGDDAIGDFCAVNYGTGYQVFKKIRVKGPAAHPLYKFLSDKKRNGRVSARPRWNFHKFLVDKNGEVADFFYPFTRPAAARVTKRIAKLL